MDEETSNAKKGKAVILFDEPEYRRYDFNSLISKTPSYLKDEADHKLLASIVAEINNLGHDEKEQRISLQQFQTKMTDGFMIKSSQESLTDQVLPSSSIAAKFKKIKQTLLNLSFNTSKEEEQNTEIELPKPQ